MMEKEKIQIMNSKEATICSRERFNAFQTGHGTWKSSKYPNRSKRKADMRKEIRQY